MGKIIMLVSLPAGGKTTKAKELLESDGNTVRVNKDDLRKMLFDIDKGNHKDKWTGKKEDLVRKAEILLVKFLLDEHRVPIIDDTNLSSSTQERWKQIALERNAKLEVIKIETTVDECIRRDALREDGVGEQVIRNMASQYGLDGEDEKQTVPEEGQLLICDLDGTLTNCDHRLHFIKDKDWDSFFDGISEDPLNENMKEIIDLSYPNHKVILVTGRPSSYRYVTKEWLKKYDIRYDALFMRRSGDYRQDDIVKQEILDKYFPDKSRIDMIFDDRPNVIRMWQRNGLKVTDMGNGIEF